MDCPEKECPLCMSLHKSLIKNSCDAMHEFCFSCILKAIESNSYNSCPSCKGSSKYIIVSNKHKIKIPEDFTFTNDTFFTIEFFNESIPLLNNLLKIDLNKSCLIEIKLLKIYILNKTQLIHAMKYYKTDPTIVSIINWNIPTTNYFSGSDTYSTSPVPGVSISLSSWPSASAGPSAGPSASGSSTGPSAGSSAGSSVSDQQIQQLYETILSSLMRGPY